MLLLLFSIIAITNFLELSIIVYLKYCVLTCVRNATTLLVGLSHDFRHLEAKKRSRRGNGLHAAMQDAMKYSDSEDESSRLSKSSILLSRMHSLPRTLRYRFTLHPSLLVCGPGCVRPSCHGSEA